MAASKELITKIVLRGQADKSLAKAFQALSKNSDTCLNKLSKIGTTAKNVFKGVGVAAAAGAAAVVGIGKAAIESYAEYEQLVGGVETLFKNNSGELIKYANEAYKTAGLSANEYMSTVTGFSAALINSLGGDTKKATELSNQAVIDMSDNANKMGTDMESIMNTYQSLSRGQFGMLDNLKLGYGGTKAEMERLLKDAEKLTGIKYDISKFSDVTQAIHVIQEKIGITGTTAKEASTTITGSLSALKGSWKNLMTGLADPSQDLGELIQKTFDSAMVFFNDNLMPRIKEVMPRISTAITKMSPLIGEAVSMLIPPLIPVVVEGASALIKAVVSNLPKIFSSLMGALPTHIAGTLTVLSAAFATFKIAGFINTVSGAIKEVKTLWTVLGMTQKVKTFISAIKNAAIWQKVATAAQWLWNTSLFGCPIVWIVAAIMALIAVVVLLVKHWDKVKEAGVKCWEAIKNAFAKIGAWIKNAFTSLIEFFKNNWKSILLFIANPIAGAFKLLYDNCEGFRNFINGIGAWIKNAFNSMVQWFAQLPSKIGTWLSGVWQKIATWGANLWTKAKEIGRNFINGIVNFFQQLPYKIGYCIGYAIGKVILFGQKLWNFATTTVPQFIGKVVDWFAKLPSRIWTWLKNAWQKFTTWGANLWAKAKEIGSKVVSSVVNFFKQLPGKVWTWLKNTIAKVTAWGTKMISLAKQKATQFVTSAVSFIKTLPSKIWTWLSNTIQKVVQWGSNLVSKAKTAAKNMVNAVINGIKSLPSKMLTFGKNVVQGLWNGIKNAKDWLIGKIKSFASGIVDGIKDALGINSPSVVMEKLFKWVPVGAGNGILNNMKYAIEAIKKMGGKVTSAASKINPSISASVSSDIPKFGTGGTLTRPQLAVVGDKAETIVPHGNTPRNRTLLAEAARGVGVSGGGSVFNFTFAPVIHGGNAEENRAMIRDEEEEFERRMDAWIAKNRRLAF